MNLEFRDNRSFDLVARWHNDCIDLHLDVVSIRSVDNGSCQAFYSNSPTTYYVVATAHLLDKINLRTKCNSRAEKCSKSLKMEHEMAPSCSVVTIVVSIALTSSFPNSGYAGNIGN